MTVPLQEALSRLREHEAELRRRGVVHAAVFGSVSRGDARTDSDVDVLIELDPECSIDLFDYTDLAMYIEEMFEEDVDVANKNTLRPRLREDILKDAINAF